MDDGDIFHILLKTSRQRQDGRVGWVVCELLLFVCFTSALILFLVDCVSRWQTHLRVSSKKPLSWSSLT